MNPISLVKTLQYFKQRKYEFEHGFNMMYNIASQYTKYVNEFHDPNEKFDMIKSYITNQIDI